MRAVAVTNTQATAPSAEPAMAPTTETSHRWIVAGWVAIGVAAATGLVFRFWTQSHLWLDEALSVNIARLPVGDIPEALRHDGHPPLFYWLLHAWMSVFGGGDSSVRALSGVCAVVALPLMWFAGKRLGGRTVAWIAVVLLALNPWALRYATEARMYSLLVVLVLAGYLLVTKAFEDDGVWWLVGIAVVTGALGVDPLLGAVPRGGNRGARRIAAAVADEPQSRDPGPRCDRGRMPRVRTVAPFVRVPGRAHGLAVGQADAAVGDPHDHRERPRWHRRGGSDRRPRPHAARSACAVRGRARTRGESSSTSAPCRRCALSSP